MVIEVTEFNFEVSLNLGGLLEVTMASEATKETKVRDKLIYTTAPPPPPTDIL